MSERFKIKDGPCDVVLDEAKGAKEVVVFLPGVRGGANTKRFDPLVDACLDAGISIARVDAWKDNVDIGNKSLNDIYDGVLGTIKRLKEEGYKTFYGIGKSFGGTVILTTPTTAFKKIVLWAPALRATETGGTLSRYESAKLKTLPSMKALTADRDTLGDFKTPALIIHGDADEIVPLANSELLVDMLPKAKLTEIEGGDHALADATHEAAVLRATIKFLST